jgi:hypothetical protein
MKMAISSMVRSAFVFLFVVGGCDNESIGESSPPDAGHNVRPDAGMAECDRAAFLAAVEETTRLLGDLEHAETIAEAMVISSGRFPRSCLEVTKRGPR